MLRRASLALFVLALGLAVACGRQVTPNPSFNSALAGQILLRYRTVAPANFSLYNYFIIFNTSGNGQEPYASGFVVGQYQNFSYSLVTGVATGGNGTVLPILVQYYLIPNTTNPLTRLFNLNPSTTQFVPDANTTAVYNEFDIIFSRAQLSLPNPNATSPPPTTSPTPTKKPDAFGPAVRPNAAPTVRPNAAPTPTPTPTAGGTSQPTPVASPTIPSQATWCMNLVITGATTSQPLDALGLGAEDHSFSSGCFNVNDNDDIVYVQNPEVNPPADPASQLYGFELVNTPTSPSP